jgi:beta-1,4-N-acetylglucosaminyltransferase
MSDPNLQWPLERYGFTPEQHYNLLYFMLACFAFSMVMTRFSIITMRGPPEKGMSAKTKPARLLIVLGSGGHTSEMLNVLQQVVDLQQDYRRTYVVSSGDGFSASKASEFEKRLGKDDQFDIVTVRRARRVHQSSYTAPVTTLLSLKDCIGLLYKVRPDIILTNGPGTGVCVVLASVLLRLCFIEGDGMRTTFIESWARVRSLSLSGKILKFFVDRFIVQWPQLVKIYGSDSVEYIGPLVR